MVPVKTTAAVLVASMSLFSAIPASAASLSRIPAKVPGTAGGGAGSTPITGSSSDGSGPVNSGAPASGGTTSGSGSSGSGSTGSTSGAPGSPGSVGGGASSSMGSSASPISSGNRPGSETGSNAPRPGPRSPAEQPNAGGSGPFGEAPEVPRTMDGTENAGFNFGNFLSGLNSMTSTLFQMVATFAMLKQIFSWFGKKDKVDAATAGEATKEVLAVADKGANVARDAATKVDEKLADEAARAEGRGAGRGTADGAANADDAEASGLARE